MKLNTCIEAAGADAVIITETTDGQQYLPEGSGLTAKNRFIYTDTASIDVFKLNAVDKVEMVGPVIVDRLDPKDVKLNLKKDGWFTSIHIVVPNKQWVYKELSKPNSIIHTYDIVYFVDGNKIYTCAKGKINNSNIQELLDETRDNTTISRIDTDYVSIKLLNGQCDELYTQIYNSRIHQDKRKIDGCEANRLEAIINLVKHYVRCGQLAEAERVIEKANHFSDNSAGTNSTNKQYLNNCGCH